MRSFITLILVFYFTCSLTAQDVITSRSSSLQLQTVNVCTFNSVLTANAGGITYDSLPTFGHGCFPMFGNFNYAHIDSARRPGTILRGFDIAPDAAPSPANKFFYVALDTSVVAWKISYPNWMMCQPLVVPHDTIYMDSIIGIQACSNDRFVLIRDAISPQTNFIVYNDSLAGLLFSLPLNIKPKLISSEGIYCSVVGTDSLNRTVLKIINLNTQMIIKDTLLGSIMNDPFRLEHSSNLVLLASTPGDTCISIFKYDMFTGNDAAQIIYNASGIHSGDWENVYFHYQPESDPSPGNLDMGVSVFNAMTMVPYANYTVNKRLRLIDYPNNSWGWFGYIYGTLDDTTTSYQRSYTFGINYAYVDSFLTGQNPMYFIADFRCDVGIDDYDDGKVQFKVHPNPASSEISITASGLICGRTYKMDMIDIQGRVRFEQEIQAKMNISIPVSELSAGTYFLRIHTRKGPVVQKIIKQ